MNKRQQEQETDGYQIARRSIAEEAEHKTGFLDLGWLGLTEVPRGFQPRQLTLREAKVFQVSQRLL